MIVAFTAKTLAQHLRNRCLREFGDSTKQDFERGERYFELSRVFRGAPVKASVEGLFEGTYHFTISEEEAQTKYRSETVWQCTVYVTQQLDVFVEDCRGSGYAEGLPEREIVRNLLSCALRGRD